MQKTKKKGGNFDWLNVWESRLLLGKRFPDFTFIKWGDKEPYSIEEMLTWDVEKQLRNMSKSMKENKIRKNYKCRKVKKMKKFLEIITGGIVGISIMFLLYIAPTL